MFCSINHIKVVKTQYDDVRAALAGQGDFKLSPAFKRFEVTIHVWAGMPADQRQKHFKRFMKKCWTRENRTVITSDGSQAFTGPWTMGGKKPHQRKRRRTAKTISTTKKQRV